MFYACLATLFCVGIGLTGLTLSVYDIERYNFGLYLALMSVVGTTVSVAFWIISPSMCANPRWVQWIINRYGYHLEPLRDYARHQISRYHKRYWDDEESGSLHPKQDGTRRTERGKKAYQESPLAAVSTSSAVATFNLMPEAVKKASQTRTLHTTISIENETHSSF